MLIVLRGKKRNRELLIDLIVAGYTETFYYRGRGDRTSRIGVFRFVFTYPVKMIGLYLSELLEKKIV